MKNLLFILIILCCSAFHTQTWELIHDEDNIKVYARSVNYSKFKETKVVTNCRISIACIRERLFDMDNYTDWFDTCIESKLLKKSNTKELYGYFVMEVPFPFQNRDLIAKLSFTTLNSTKIIANIEAFPRYLPKNRNRTRVAAFRSIWSATAISTNQTHIELIFNADMGGHLPIWAVNSAAKWGPFMSVKKMRNYCLGVK